MTGKRKQFIPLENNPEVFSQLATNLGASSITFHDVYSIHEPELIALIPRPVSALIFICPSAVYHAAREKENDLMSVYTGSGPSEPAIWFKQTIGNACGLMALIHALSNGAARAHLLPGSLFSRLLQDAIPLDTAGRARVLEDSEALENAHGAAARLGDTIAPDPAFHPDPHFICFVKGDDGHLWELNGEMKGPVDRGALTVGEDALSEHALQIGVKTFLAAAQDAGIEDIRFSIVALAVGHP